MEDSDNDSTTAPSYVVNLKFRNYEFEVTVDHETFTNLQNDEDFKLAFAKQTYENLMRTEQEPVEIDFPPSEDPKSNFKWTKAAADILIELRLNREAEFNDPKTKKSELWQQISNEMSESNFHVTADMCDAKYRNLLHTYKVNKKKERQQGIETIKWEHFDTFEVLLGRKASTIFKEEATVGKSPFVNMIERKRKYQMAEWLLKMKSENDDKKLRLKEKIWAEKKELKEKEVEAMQQIAKALHQNNRQCGVIFKLLSRNSNAH